MEEEAVNELVIYLAHCNRREHLNTVMEMVRQDAACRAALDVTRDEVRALRGDAPRYNPSVESLMDRMERNPYARR